MSPANAEAQLARLAEELRAAKAGEPPVRATGACPPAARRLLPPACLSPHAAHRCLLLADRLTATCVALLD